MFNPNDRIITITRDNIEQFRNNPNDPKYEQYSDVLWEAGDIDNEILDMFPNMSYINCENNGIISINSLQKYYNLEYIFAKNNNIEKLGYLHVSSFPKLKMLSLSNNMLSDLFDIDVMINLEYLEVDNNMLGSKRCKKKCVAGKRLCIHCTPLRSLKYITALKDFNCNNNPNLKTLIGLHHCKNLEHLSVNNCGLKNLRSSLKKRTNYFPKLKTISLVDNPKCSFSCMKNCHKLINILCSEKIPTKMIKHINEEIDILTIHDNFIEYRMGFVQHGLKMKIEIETIDSSDENIRSLLIKYKI